MDKTLCLWINVKGSGYSLRFNDMIVANTVKVDSSTRLIPIHEFVLQGKNVMSVLPIWQTADFNYIKAPTHQRRLLNKPVHIEVKLQLIKDRGPNVLVEPQTLQSWSNTIHPSDIRLGMVGLEAELDLPFTFSRWRWADLSISTIGLDRVEKMVKERIEQMCYWVEKGDEESFLRQFNVRVEDYSKAYGLDLIETATRFKQSIGLNEFRLKLADCTRELDQLKLIACRNDSVVFPINNRAEAFFQLINPKTRITYQLDMHFAAFGENIYVVR